MASNINTQMADTGGTGKNPTVGASPSALAAQRPASSTTGNSSVPTGKAVPVDYGNGTANGSGTGTPYTSQYGDNTANGGGPKPTGIPAINTNLGSYSGDMGVGGSIRPEDSLARDGSFTPASTGSGSGLPGLDTGGSGGYSGGGGYGGGGGYAAPSIPSTGYSSSTLLKQKVDNPLEATPYNMPEIDGPHPERIEHVDIADQEAMLQQIVDAQKEQSQRSADYTVERGVNELNRAMEDAAVQYQTQRNQAAADEARALDNQALYAEARGDRGGIGQAQYAAIQAAAAQNRRAVNDAQVKLGTDTARQISDLRAQGEFEKADQLLSITQNYLSQLMSLEQWALSTNLGVDEFNSQLQQWVDEYNLNVQQYLSDLDLSTAQMTGVFADGTQTLAYQQQLNNSLASSGSALLSAGVLPSKQQLKAMGLTATQAKAYLRRMGYKV